jgi:hypothetical protein
MDKIEVLKTLVGSHAHGLQSPTSDYDYRGVYLYHTSDLLRVDAPAYKGTHWVEGEDTDNTAYEIAHFLHLSTKSNPSILEVYKSPVVFSLEIDGWKVGEELLSLFPYVWSSEYVRNAFRGYSHNQHKKMFDPKVEYRRRSKYGVAHLRVLLLAIELLQTGDMHVDVQDDYSDFGLSLAEAGIVKSAVYNGSWRRFLLDIKQDNVSVGHIVNTAEYLSQNVDLAYEHNPSKQSDLEPINDFLLRTRKAFWS